MKILFVCRGNHIRSAMAEVLLKKHAGLARLPWRIHSAGTNHWNKGSSADPRAVAVCAAHGVDLSCHIARRFKVSDFGAYDRIYAMHPEIMPKLRRLAGDFNLMEKVIPFMDPVDPSGKTLLTNPWFECTEQDFVDCYRIIDEVCAKIVRDFVGDQRLETVPGLTWTMPADAGATRVS